MIKSNSLQEAASAIRKKGLSSVAMLFRQMEEQASGLKASPTKADESRRGLPGRSSRHRFVVGSGFSRDAFPANGRKASGLKAYPTKADESRRELPGRCSRYRFVVGSGFSERERDAFPANWRKASGLKASPTQADEGRRGFPGRSSRYRLVVGSGFSRPEKGTSFGRDAFQRIRKGASGLKASPTKADESRCGFPGRCSRYRFVVGSGFSRRKRDFLRSRCFSENSKRSIGPEGLPYESRRKVVAGFLVGLCVTAFYDSWSKRKCVRLEGWTYAPSPCQENP